MSKGRTQTDVSAKVQAELPAVIVEEASERQRALAIPRTRNLIVPQGTPVKEWPTNIDLLTPAGPALMANAQAGKTIEFKDGKCRMTVKYWLSYPDSYVDAESGEVKEVSRLVLISPDGLDAFATTSEVAPKRWGAIVDLIDAGVLKLPLEIEIREMPSKGRAPWHQIFVVPPA